MTVLEKICDRYEFDFGDIINFVRDAKEDYPSSKILQDFVKDMIK